MLNRRVFWALFLVLLVGATALVWVGGQRRALANTIQPDRDSLALVPAQATAVFGLDLDGLRATSVYATWQQHRQARKPDPEYDEYLARTGFDIERDLEAVTGAAWKNGTQPVFLIVATARFNSSLVSGFLKEKGAKVETYGGVELLLPDEHHTKSGEDYPVVVLGLPDRPNTILAGASAAVKQALDLRAHPAFSVLNNQALLARVQAIGAENQVWAVALTPGALLPSQLPAVPPAQANVARILQGMQSSIFTLSATNGLRLLAQGTCSTADDARTLAEAARGLLAMARLMAPANQPQAIELLNSLQIDQQQSDVRLTAAIPPQLLDQLAQQPQMFLPHSHHQAQPQRHR